MVRIGDVRVRDLEEFPLVLQVAIREGFDSNGLKREGYQDVDSYFYGQSLFNSSIIGWRGKIVA